MRGSGEEQKRAHSMSWRAARLTSEGRKRNEAAAGVSMITTTAMGGAPLGVPQEEGKGGDKDRNGSRRTMGGCGCKESKNYSLDEGDLE